MPLGTLFRRRDFKHSFYYQKKNTLIFPLENQNWVEWKYAFCAAEFDKVKSYKEKEFVSKF